MTIKEGKLGETESFPVQPLKVRSGKSERREKRKRNKESERLTVQQRAMRMKSSSWKLPLASSQKKCVVCRFVRVCVWVSAHNRSCGLYRHSRGMWDRSG